MELKSYVCLKGIKVGSLVHMYVLLASVKVEVACGQAIMDNLSHFATISCYISLA